MKKIIVPIDFSNHSEYALKVAALLAKKNKATIYALHMLDINDVTLSESTSYSKEKAVFLLKLAEKKFKKFLNKEYLEGVKVVPAINHYKVFSQINTIAKEINADLIIMGSHGATGLKEFFVGSNTEKVIRYATVPVLIIKNELVDVNFGNIVFATDFSEESIPAFKKMIETIKLFQARLQILYVNLPNEDFKTSTEMDTLATNFLQKVDGNIDRLINVNYVCERSVESGILNFSNTIGADLIAVITHGRKGLSHIFAGSIAEDIGNHSTLPIISFKI
ncbi:universal stress protein [Polaribacter sp.]|uniref:universal stress protein n=1 Tax=Polaribacter sp. TaxID=1920175 RepID=UPI003EF88EEC